MQTQNVDISILQLAPDNCIIETAKKSLAKLFGQFGDLRPRFHRRGKPSDLDLAKPVFLHVKLQQRIRHWPRMSRVEVKIRRKDREAFRVWGLDREDSSATQPARAQPDRFRQTSRFD